MIRSLRRRRLTNILVLLALLLLFLLVAISSWHFSQVTNELNQLRAQIFEIEQSAEIALNEIQSLRQRATRAASDAEEAQALTIQSYEELNLKLAEFAPQSAQVLTTTDRFLLLPLLRETPLSPFERSWLIDRQIQPEHDDRNSTSDFYRNRLIHASILLSDLLDIQFSSLPSQEISVVIEQADLIESELSQLIEEVPDQSDLLAYIHAGIASVNLVFADLEPERSTTAYRNLAQALRIIEAEPVVELTFSYQQGLIELLRRMGDLGRQHACFDIAGEHFLKVKNLVAENDALTPSYVESHGLGNVFLSQKDFPQAMRYFQEAIRLRKLARQYRSTVALTEENIGIVLLHQGQFIQTILHANNILDANPSLIWNRFVLAFAYRSVEDYENEEKALKELERIVKADTTPSRDNQFVALLPEETAQYVIQHYDSWGVPNSRFQGCSRFID